MTKKKFYAVYRGQCEPAPGIFDSWAKASPLVTGCKGNCHKAFTTLEEAEKWMQLKGVSPPYYMDIDDKSMITTPIFKSEGPFHAVSEGREPGVYPNSWPDAEMQVKRFSGACHVRVGSREEAEHFNKTYKIRKFHVDETRRRQKASDESKLDGVISSMRGLDL
ncbi:hypothetical protein L228DRAFT_249719 [Xylona heveae TC161]|uniref:Ribonuclease H1 N-terminal domain-containing protein n=1 Tax=Xylona heveae (strain CBS 132557 / TC161) TaxID=1328760 RepID=A0A161T9Y4_XYLHT|nr:hypothetical protein L228DRAFT_249719 [Xylona heveae TC161]KZF20887.1 hypothetical protein L228DRAFT_249719 [Xylona heveae TC161]